MDADSDLGRGPELASALGSWDYGTAFATNFDLLGVEDSLVANDLFDGAWLGYEDDLFDAINAPSGGLRVRQEHQNSDIALSIDAQSDPSSRGQATTVPPNQRQAEIYSKLEDVEKQLRKHTFQGDTQHLIETTILPLRIKKAQLWLELHRSRLLPGASRDLELVLLELEEVTLRLDLLVATTSPQERDEHEEYHLIRISQIRLEKEASQLRQQAAIPALDFNTVKDVLSHAMIANNTSATSRNDQAPRFATHNAQPSANAEQMPESMLMERDQSHPSSVATVTNESPYKKPKRSQDQIQNRRDVQAAGGQCLNCRNDRSKPACDGEGRCSRCESKGLECIRPTLRDKNVFSARINLSYRQIPSSDVNSKGKRAMICSIIQDFFDMSEHPFITLHPDVFQLLDHLHGEIVSKGFYPDVASARMKALSGLCAFNVFVKTNVVANNWHLPFVRATLKEFVGKSVKGNAHPTSHAQDISSSSESQQLRAATLTQRCTDSYNHINTLRALSSEYVFLILEEFLREGHIRDCRGYGNLSKKASLLAALGLTLEQALDLSDHQKRNKVHDPELQTMLRQLSLVLLSYMQPPSPLAFPEGAKINSCFGKLPSSITGVFMEDAFWLELYKASSKALPSHLLQTVGPEGSPHSILEPVSPVVTEEQIIKPASSSKKAKEENSKRIQSIARAFMGMNLRFPRRDATGMDRQTATEIALLCPDSMPSSQSNTTTPPRKGRRLVRRRLQSLQPSISATDMGDATINELESSMDLEWRMDSQPLQSSW